MRSGRLQILDSVASQQDYQTLYLDCLSRQENIVDDQIKSADISVHVCYRHLSAACIAL